jgi:hypothetical protein
MSGTAYSISEIVKEAGRAGPESEPAQLLKLLAGLDNPVFQYRTLIKSFISWCHFTMNSRILGP